MFRFDILIQTLDYKDAKLSKSYAATLIVENFDF